MISQRIRGVYALSIGVQLALSQALFWAHYTVFDLFYSYISPYVGTYFIYSLIVLAGLGIEATSRRSMDCDWTDKNLLLKHNAALRQTLFTAGAIFLFIFATKDHLMSRVFLFTYLPLLYAVLLLTTRTLPNFAVRFLFHWLRRQNTLLVGPMGRARALNLWLHGKQHFGFEIAGVLTDDGVPRAADLPCLGTLEHLETIVRENKISHVILVEPPADVLLLSKTISDCERLGVRLLVVSDLQEKFRHKIIYMETGGMHFIALREEPLENPVNRLLKRGLDIAVALPVVVCILPVAGILVWLLHRLQSPGPLFYVQDRAGFQNNVFSIIKFRSMGVDNPDAARQATRDDKRIFPAGKWLRRSGIDELPQFWNVLLGHMSVVGPRPHLREHNDQFARVFEKYHIRSLVKPGITGLAQVQGLRGEAHDEAALVKRIEADIHYLENWSFAADLIIILRTARQVLFPPKTAY